MALSAAAQQTASLTISNQASELDKVLIWLEQQSNHFQLSERIQFQLDLVLNEALPNIFSYAFSESNSHPILINLMDINNVIVLEIVDDGIAFNPLVQEDYQPSPALTSATIGGRGIHLIKSFSDAQEYQRMENSNILRLSFLKATIKANHPSQEASA